MKQDEALTIRASGEMAVTVEFEAEISLRVNRKVAALKHVLEQMQIKGITELTPAYRSLTVHYDPEMIRYGDLTEQLLKAAGKMDEEELPEQTVLEIPVLYGGEWGPDLVEVARHEHMEPEEVIKKHSSNECYVYMIGFSPGNAYIGNPEKTFTVPRRKTPRVKIPQGAVTIWESQTTIFPMEQPGGWNVIGRTPFRMFDLKREPAFLLKAGQWVKFRPVSEKEYGQIEKQLMEGDVPVSYMEKGGTAMSIEIINGGLLTTVQDGGRYGYQQYGVMVSGAMDYRSMALANILAGNDETEAVLEMTLLGVTIRFGETCVFAATGADMQPELNGRRISMYQAVRAEKGDILSFSGIKDTGCRTYLAFAGGMDIPVVMGSKSTLLRAGLGGYKGRSLKAGDKIKLLAPGREPENLSFRKLAKESLSGGEVALRVVMGPQEDRFTQAGIATFLSSVYEVGSENDRMGYRLEGPLIEHKKDGNIITDGIVFGSIQVPSGGKPIIMMADRQCTGGYTKIGTVIRPDLPFLAQCKTKNRIQFQKISVEEAQEAYIAWKQEFKNIRKKLDCPMEVAEIKNYSIHVSGKVFQVEVKEYAKNQT